MSATLANMSESPRRFAAPPFGFYVLALEIYAFVAASLALREHFIAPLGVIFFALDHTEFLIFVGAVLCGVDLYLKPTGFRAIVFAVALLPFLAMIIAIIVQATR